MNRRELVNAIAAQTDTNKKDVEVIVQGFTDVITAVVAKGEPVAISGFAKFTKVERKARMGRNPATGEQIKIKASKKARVTPLKAFKDSVLNPSQAPKLNRGVWPPAPAAAAKPASTRGRAAAATAKPAATRGRAAAAKPAATRGRAAAAKTTTTARRTAPKKATTTRATTTRRATSTTRSGRR
jgi:DNA-binding protein HU-beta